MSGQPEITRKAPVAFTFNKILPGSSYAIFLQLSSAYGHILQVIRRSLFTKRARLMHSAGK